MNKNITLTFLLILFLTFLAMGCRLTGIVTHMGTPVSGAVVKIIEKTSGNVVGSYVTDENGQYMTDEFEYVDLETMGGQDWQFEITVEKKLMHGIYFRFAPEVVTISSDNWESVLADGGINFGTQLFNPTKHGLHFINQFTGYMAPPFTGYELLNVALVAEGFYGLPHGMCGGMSFTALDYFYAGIPVPTNTKVPTDALDGMDNEGLFYDFMWTRHVDAWLLPLLNSDLIKVTAWNNGSETPEALKALSLEEFEKENGIRASLDNGVPVPIGMLYDVPDRKVFHTVIGHSYDIVSEVGSPDTIFINIYNPSFPALDSDDETHAIMMSDDSNLNDIYLATRNLQGVLKQTYKPLQGIFIHTNYTPVEPWDQVDDTPLPTTPHIMVPPSAVPIIELVQEDTNNRIKVEWTYDADDVDKYIVQWTVDDQFVTEYNYSTTAPINCDKKWDWGYMTTIAECDAPYPGEVVNGGEYEIEAGNTTTYQAILDLSTNNVAGKEVRIRISGCHQKACSFYDAATVSTIQGAPCSDICGEWSATASIQL